jgi:hypothetical protein
MITIGKNQKSLIYNIFKNAKNVKYYSSDNYYNGKDTEIKCGEKDFINFKSSRLRYNENGKYTIYISGNLWYDFESIKLEDE